MQTFGLPLEWESTSPSLVSTECSLSLERPGQVVFQCFTHLADVTPPQRLLERESVLHGRPGSSTMQLLRHLRTLPKTPSSTWMLTQSISKRSREWPSLCMTSLVLVTPSTKPEKNCSVSRTEQWISFLQQR